MTGAASTCPTAASPACSRTCAATTSATRTPSSTLRATPSAPGFSRTVPAWPIGCGTAAGASRSVHWTARNGLNLLSGNVVFGDQSDDFTTTQLTLIADYRRLIDPVRPARVAVGRVIVPFDSADHATRERYRAYAASRHDRTLGPQGTRRVLFAPDIVGTAEQILEQLRADPVLAQTSELRLELPSPRRARDDAAGSTHRRNPGVRRTRTVAACPRDRRTDRRRDSCPASGTPTY